MTDQLPDPLVPAEVDLRGLDYMPFFGNHLFGSDFNARCTDAEWRAGVTLWWAAWNQQPAGSLPDDDMSLCRLADLGRDVKLWRKVKANAMRGFVKCSDDRLYHSFLCKQVLVAWEKRIQERERKRKWREKKEGRNADGDGDKTGTGSGTEQGRDGLVPADGKRSEANGMDGNINPTSKAVALVKQEGAPAIAEALRHAGMKISEMHPSIQQLAEQGVSKEIAVEAYRIAVQDRGKASPAIGYLMPIINDLRTAGTNWPHAATSKVVIGMGKLQEIIDG